MRCTRCAGLLVKEWLHDYRGEPPYVPATKCVNCGDVQEPVMIMNRKKVQDDRSIQA